MENNTTESLSLYIIQTISKAVEYGKSSYCFLEETLPPSEILSMSGKFIGILNQLDGCVSVISDSQGRLYSAYRREYDNFAKIRNDLLASVNERQASGVQLNTGADLFSETEVLSNIVFNPYNQLEVTEVKEMPEYSALSIYNRLKNREGVHLDVMDRMLQDIPTNMKNAIDACRMSLTNFRSLLNSPKFMETMATDITTPECSHIISVMNSSISHITRLLDSIRKKIIDLFQVYLVTRKNFTVYQNAIRALTSFALESAFGPNLAYDLV